MPSFSPTVTVQSTPAVSVTSSGSSTPSYEQVRRSLGDNVYNAYEVYLASQFLQQISGVLQFNKYDSNGNILKVETSSNGTIWNIDQISTYDDKSNAIDSSDLISLWGSSDGIVNSGNNNVKSRSKVGAVNFNIQYTYNNNNKPVSSNYTQTSQNTTISGSREYFY